MGFKFFHLNTNKPIRLSISYWLVCILISVFLSLPTQVFSVSTNKINKVIREHNINFFGVLYDKKKNKYSTLSASFGKSEFTINEKKMSGRKLLKDYNNNQIHFMISSFNDSISEITPYLNTVTYLNLLPENLNKYFKIMNVDAFNLTIDYILVKTEKKIFYESKELPISNNVKLIFIDKINDKQLKSFTEYMERYLVSTFPHELFHFLVGYENLIRMSELREETYAHFFGDCIAYEITGEVFFPLDIIELSVDFVDSPVSEIRRIKKILKKQKLIKSRIAGAISQLYFRAIANNKDDNNFTSDKIPKFCHKLFSEHNFKHPIEKKPPVWFKEFLAE